MNGPMSGSIVAQAHDHLAKSRVRQTRLVVAAEPFRELLRASHELVQLLPVGERAHLVQVGLRGGDGFEARGCRRGRRTSAAAFVVRPWVRVAKVQRVRVIADYSETTGPDLKAHPQAEGAFSRGA